MMYFLYENLVNTQHMLFLIVIHVDRSFIDYIIKESIESYDVDLDDHHASCD